MSRFFARVMATLMISVLFITHSKVCLLVLGDNAVEMMIVSFSPPCME